MDQLGSSNGDGRALMTIDVVGNGRVEMNLSRKNYWLKCFLTRTIAAPGVQDQPQGHRQYKLGVFRLRFLPYHKFRLPATQASMILARLPEHTTIF